MMGLLQNSCVDKYFYFYGGTMNDLTIRVRFRQANLFDIITTFFVVYGIYSVTWLIIVILAT